MKLISLVDKKADEISSFRFLSKKHIISFFLLGNVQFCFTILVCQELVGALALYTLDERKRVAVKLKREKTWGEKKPWHLPRNVDDQ